MSARGPTMISTSSQPRRCGSTPICSARRGSAGGSKAGSKPICGRRMRSTPIIRTWSAITCREGRWMRAFAFVSALSLLAAPARAAPERVASLNLCTDELLLQLGDARQIVSITHLAQQAAETPLWARARLHKRNDGSLASVAALRPDLVLTMGGGARDRSGIARRLGIRLLDLPYPQSL